MFQFPLGETNETAGLGQGTGEPVGRDQRSNYKEIHMRAAGGNSKPRTAGRSHRQGAFDARHLAAGGATFLLLLFFAWIPAGASAASEYLQSFGPDGTATSAFEHVSSVAVDQQTGSVYVLDAGSLYKFDSEGKPVDWGGAALYITGNRIGGIVPYVPPGGFGLQAQVAVDSASHLVYVTEEHSLRAFQASGEPAEFTAGPGMGKSEIPGFSALRGVAIDVNGAIYTGDFAGTVSVFASTGQPITSFPALGAANLAVASDGKVYVTSEKVYVEPSEATFKRFTPNSFPVTAATTWEASEPLFLSNAAPAGVAVDPLTDDYYLVLTNYGSSWIKKYDKSGAFLGSFGEPGTPGDDEGFGSSAEGIAVVGGGSEISGNREVHFYAGNTETSAASSYSKVDIFGNEEEIGPPDVEFTSAIDVTADSATLRAFIDPNTAETAYHFEYGLADCSLGGCTAVPIGGASIGDGIDPIEVTQALSDLQPGTTYHFRAIAENEFGPPTQGPGLTFTTQRSGLGFELIDSRAWEMVSPPDKLGGQLVYEGGPRQAAADGDGVAYLSRGAIEDPDGNRALENSSVLARRSSSGWVSEDVIPPNENVVGFEVGGSSEYQLFSSDLARAILSQRSGTPLSPQASERTLYLRENAQPPFYTPLITGKEGFANVPLGTVFGGDEKEGPSPLAFAGATPSFSHVVIISSVPLVAGGPVGETAAYLWRPGEQIRPVSMLPDAEGGTWVSGPDLQSIGSFQGSVENAISDDGSRIFWENGGYLSSGNHAEALFVRDTLAEETTRLDVPQEGASGAGTSHPVFVGASADGTVVFFKASRQLTADASSDGFDLYRCEIPPSSASAGCASLTDISIPVAAGESANVLGIPPGLSEDGRRIYFFAKGVLDEAPNQYGDAASAGGPNLYLWQEGEGARFIARLPETDDTNWGKPEPESLSEGLSATLNPLASPSGRYLSFMSKRSLTGYVNLEETSGEPAQEVFRYDAVADALECVSCNPSGAAPEGEEVVPGSTDLMLQGLWSGELVAATLPESTLKSALALPFYKPRAVLDNGRVFFNAIDSLVPADSNGEWDVYQYESLGVGGCSSSSGDAATARSAGGCVSLLTSGTAEEEAGFFDASASGDDVFFLTPARLSITDEDNQVDLYDARVDGVTATLRPRAECQGEACQPPAIVPEDSSPGTSTFQGPGDPKPKAGKTCPKTQRKVRHKSKVGCVPRKHRKHPRGDRKAGKSGRAGR
jgi:hypothetical protein